MSKVNFYAAGVKGIFDCFFFNQYISSLSVPFVGPICTVHTTDLKFFYLVFKIASKKLFSRSRDGSLFKTDHTH